VNSRAFNVIAWVTTAIVIILSVIYAYGIVTHKAG
jgi:hypothetical protein